MTVLWFGDIREIKKCKQKGVRLNSFDLFIGVISIKGELFFEVVDFLFVRGQLFSEVVFP